MDVIDEAGYVPNAFARGLGLNTMKTIGLLCPDASDAYQAHALSLLEHAFRKNQYDSLLVCTGRERAELNNGIESLVNRHVDGMVLMGSTFIGRDMQENRSIIETAQSIPVVILNGSLSQSSIYSVACDDEEGTLLAVKHVAMEGRRCPLYLYHALNESGEKKLSGFWRGVRDYHLESLEEHAVFISRGQKTVPDVTQIVKACMESGIRFDSVITSEDTLAVGAMKALKSMGKSVPGDVSVIGYNNSELCLCTEPELTSIDNRLPALCEQIAETMVGVLEGKEMPFKTVFNAHIIERESTLPMTTKDN